MHVESTSSAWNCSFLAPAWTIVSRSQPTFLGTVEREREINSTPSGLQHQNEIKSREEKIWRLRYHGHGGHLQNIFDLELCKTCNTLNVKECGRLFSFPSNLWERIFQFCSWHIMQIGFRVYVIVNEKSKAA